VLSNKPALDVASSYTFSYEEDWMRRSIMSSIHHYRLLKSQDKELRIPRILLQSDFTSALRYVALSYLRQTAFLSRFVAYMDLLASEAISSKFAPNV
jgi:hypothetical protein